MGLGPLDSHSVRPPKTFGLVLENGRDHLGRNRTIDLEVDVYLEGLTFSRVHRDGQHQSETPGHIKSCEHRHATPESLDALEYSNLERRAPDEGGAREALPAATQARNGRELLREACSLLDVLYGSCAGAVGGCRARRHSTLATWQTSRPTTFVTGAAGFIGTELVKLLVARGHQVFGLARSLEAAQRVRRAGAVPVMGDLLEPGQWQDEAAADWVFHLPPHPCGGRRVTRRRAASVTRARVLMDAHLLDAVAAGATRRIVYVADTSCYGATGPRPITEDEPPRPSAWGRCLTPALDRLDGYVVAGLPIVTAFPGLGLRQRLVVSRTRHRAGHGWPSRPAVWKDRAVGVAHSRPRLCPRAGASRRARRSGRPVFPREQRSDPDARVRGNVRRVSRTVRLRVWRVPAAATRLVVGPVLADYIQADAVFSNIRLRGIGFRFRYPTLEQGLQQVLGALHE